MNIFNSLADARNSGRNVYAQLADDSWQRIYRAKTDGFILYVQSLGCGRWFIPQQWEVR